MAIDVVIVKTFFEREIEKIFQIEKAAQKLWPKDE